MKTLARQANRQLFTRQPEQELQNVNILGKIPAKVAAIFISSELCYVEHGIVIGMIRLDLKGKFKVGIKVLRASDKNLANHGSIGQFFIHEMKKAK